MVSTAVETAAPDEVALLPELASALMAALRAELLLALAAAVALADAAVAAEAVLTAVTVPAGRVRLLRSRSAAAGRRHVNIAQRRPDIAYSADRSP